MPDAGDETNAKKYARLAHDDAQHWMHVADAGGHSLLAFDKPNTWSQKYNLVWDQILGLDVFPRVGTDQRSGLLQGEDAASSACRWIRARISPKPIGPSGARRLLTSKADFEAILSPIYDYINKTTARDPIADSYVTDDITSGGMHARPVVGGFFIKMLDNASIWKKWAGRDHQKIGSWAPLPKPPVIEELIPTARTSSPSWKYTLNSPAAGWNAKSFDDSSWSTGTAGFGTEGTPSIVVKTKWSTDDIWLRRQIKLPITDLSNAVLSLFHDEDVEVYFDGVLAASEPGFITNYEIMAISDAAKEVLKPGATITVAVHCHQTTGGQGIDVGISRLVK